MPENISRKERKKIESFHRQGEDINLGVVLIDQELCNGCGVCTRACAAACLEVVDKKCRMVDEFPFCMSCGDCVAICPEDAIQIREFIKFNRHFKYLDRGEPAPPRKF